MDAAPSEPSLDVSFDTPVVVIAFNRPHHATRLVDLLRTVRPSHLLVVLDGPRPGVQGDAAACAATARAFDAIDWPCKVETDVSPRNLGCGNRVRSGLDWAFARVERAIILEDDIDPHPSFFAWAKAALDAFANDERIAAVNGHNPLVRWEAGSPTGGFLGRRDSVYGWATWAHVWRAFRDAERNVSDAVHGDAFETLDPATKGLMTWFASQARRYGSTLSWDVAWSYWIVATRRSVIVSTVNLIHNLGIGPDATHQASGHDLLHTLPRYPAIPTFERAAHAREEVAAHVDRARTLLELLVRVENPGVARRLARASGLPLASEMQLHLQPFVHADETRRWLRHLGRHGVPVAVVDTWLEIVTGARRHRA